MTASHMLDWTVALLVCWASLTAIVQSRHEASRCDIPYATGYASQDPPAIPTPAEIEETIRDMKLHD
ncbi:hypothetical protein [Bradyrhizobium genosp. P]|uniref:hypothetical protein n=1 Tax=Bradyrhizobium genosp. P TaxID=83641 RepID=UPI003CF1616B